MSNICFGNKEQGFECINAFSKRFWQKRLAFAVLYMHSLETLSYSLRICAKTIEEELSMIRVSRLRSPIDFIPRLSLVAMELRVAQLTKLLVFGGLMNALVTCARASRC